MVRRTSKKSKRKKKTEVETVRSVLERVRRDQERWMVENMRTPVPEENMRTPIGEPIPYREPRHLHRMGYLEPIHSVERLNRSVLRITGHCSTCSQILTEDYPDDYPEEYKFCCSCLSWARVIAKDEKESLLTEAIKVSNLCHKINKRMTLYNGESKRIN